MNYGLDRIFKRQSRPNVRRELIFITGKTQVGNSRIIENLFKKYGQENVDIKFGILGKPSNNFKDLLTRGRGGSHLAFLNDKEDSIYKFFTLLRPTRKVPGKKL